MLITSKGQITIPKNIENHWVYCHIPILNLNASGMNCASKKQSKLSGAKESSNRWQEKVRLP